MKWGDWVGPVRITLDPPGYTLSYRLAMDDTGILEAWFNAGTAKDPRPVFIGSVRGINHHYTPEKKQAAAQMYAACEAHQERLMASSS